MLSLLSQLLARRLDQHLDPPHMKTTPLHSPSTIMIPLATCLSTPSHFLQSPSMPPHSSSRPPSHMDFLYKHLPLESRQHPTMCSMTAPHIECYPMATALPLYTPMAHAQSAWCTLSPSHVTPYYRKTHMRSLCEPATSDMEYKKL